MQESVDAEATNEADGQTWPRHALAAAAHLNHAQSAPVLGQDSDFEHWEPNDWGAVQSKALQSSRGDGAQAISGKIQNFPEIPCVLNAAGDVCSALEATGDSSGSGGCEGRRCGRRQRRLVARSGVFLGPRACCWTFCPCEVDKRIPPGSETSSHSSSS